MIEPAHKQAQGVKMPETQSASSNAEHKFIAASVEKHGLPWQPIGTVPKDGLPTWLKSEEGKIVEGYWRRTRQYRKGMWQEVFFWAMYNQNPQAVPFDPAWWTREQPHMQESEDAA